jgi:hypothetical protein
MDIYNDISYIVTDTNKDKHIDIEAKEVEEEKLPKTIPLAEWIDGLLKACID